MFCLPRKFSEELHQLVVHGFALGGRAAFDCVRCAMSQVMPEKSLSHRAQSFPNGRNLHENVSAVSTLFHHFLKPTHLALDPPQPF